MKVISWVSIVVAIVIVGIFIVLFLTADVFFPREHIEGGRKIGQKELPIVEATELDEAPGKTVEKKEVTLAVGGESEFEGVTLKFLKVLEDSRCPSNVQCVWAGEVKLSLSLKSGTEHRIVSLKNSDEPSVFKGVSVTITDVRPEAKQGVGKDEIKYLVRFLLTKI
ncbi:MAG TPA: hypothetical protein VJH55_02595 [Candidatus Paceibacterota bacterium]